jgi:cold shock CspA family protein
MALLSLSSSDVSSSIIEHLPTSEKNSLVSTSIEESPTTPNLYESLILDEMIEKDVIVGKFLGHVKWFNDRLGYGFCTIISGTDLGKDIFVHHSGIRPLNSNYKTLRKGEYINFNMTTGHNGMQASDVTGVNGGPLMCDVSPTHMRCRVYSRIV